MARSPLRLCSALFLLGAGILGCGDEFTKGKDILVSIGGVGVDPHSDAMVVLLEEKGGSRILPIWIGRAEARSIAIELEELEFPRPNAHDLATRLLTGLEGQLQRVVVTELRSGTYYALLVIERQGRLIEVDARPSDAIAIALRANAPVFVREPLFHEGEEETEAAGHDEGFAL